MARLKILNAFHRHLRPSLLKEKQKLPLSYATRVVGICIEDLCSVYFVQLSPSYERPGGLTCALGASSLIKQLEKQSASTGGVLCLALIKVLWDHLFKTSNLRFGYQILSNSQQSSKAL